MTKSFTAKAAKIARERKSLTAKDAKDAEEKNSLTAKAAKEGKNIFQKPSPKDAKTTPRVASG